MAARMADASQQEQRTRKRPAQPPASPTSSAEGDVDDEDEPYGIASSSSSSGGISGAVGGGGVGTGSHGAPMYDPGADDLDEALIGAQRGGRRSDAILSCPGCFTTLCVDCQRHARFHTQYRALFVMNCVASEASGIGVSSSSSSNRSKQRVPSAGGVHRERDVAELPVVCAVCATQVGAQDAEGVYHFYNTLPSNA